MDKFTESDERLPPANTHKQVLAQEVFKLRQEIASLRAGRAVEEDDYSQENQIKMARIEIARLEAQKLEIVAQANAQKANLAKEASALRAELERLGRPQNRSNNQTNNAPGREMAEALLKRREFEDNFTRTLRDLRKELENTSLKHLSSRDQADLIFFTETSELFKPAPMGIRTLLQLSNERIDMVMEECSRVPVEDRLHIEALRLLIENSKLRKCLNEYSSEFLNKTILKAESVADNAANERLF